MNYFITLIKAILNYPLDYLRTIRQILLSVLLLQLLLFTSASGKEELSGVLPLLLNSKGNQSAVCGNNIVEASENCDDGNMFSGDYCEPDCKTLGPLAGINEPGRWGQPINTFTLQSGYVPDVQATYPTVDWQTLDRLYIPAGTYNSIWLGNLPNRTAGRPLIITNYNGQVVLGDTSTSKLVLEGGSNWVLTGRYDPISATGHQDFSGHAEGNYADSQGNYGIYIKQGYAAGNGLTVRGGATDFELEFIEIAEVGFAGINIKNDNQPDQHMANVKIHDMYIRDAESECMYIGNTSKEANEQHRFENLWVFNNRCIRCGTEGLQLSHIGDGSRVFNNVFIATALDWKDPFQGYQEGNFQIMIRPGTIIVENNIFIGGVNSQISLRALAASSETKKNSDALILRNNYFSHSRGTSLSYIHRYESNLNSTFQVENNYFGEIISQRHELLPDETPESFYFQSKYNKDNPLKFYNNIFEGSRDGFSTISGVNGQSENLTATGNSYGTLPLLKFANSGFASDFDYRRIEMWSDCNRAYQENPDNLLLIPPNSIKEISYEVDDIVTFYGEFYRLDTALASSYQCDKEYWRPCTDSDPYNYPIDYDTVNSYSVGTIIDTGEERFYELMSPHVPYLCTPSERHNNPHPENDPAWQRVIINASPDTQAGAQFWTKISLPLDDVRLTHDSPFKEAGLLDVHH